MNKEIEEIFSLSGHLKLLDPCSRLASVGILGKKENQEYTLGWQGNFDTAFERNTFSFKITCVGFLNFFKIATALLVYPCSGPTF